MTTPPDASVARNMTGYSGQLEVASATTSPFCSPDRFRAEDTLRVVSSISRKEYSLPVSPFTMAIFCASEAEFWKM